MYIFLHYFERGGSIVMLDYKLHEEINNLRNRVTEYREEDVDYQFERRVMMAVPKDSYTEWVNRNHVAFGIERIDMNKF
jgi:hypothetical protein